MAFGALHTPPPPIWEWVGVSYARHAARLHFLCVSHSHTHRALSKQAGQPALARQRHIKPGLPEVRPGGG